MGASEREQELGREGPEAGAWRSWGLKGLLSRLVQCFREVRCRCSQHHHGRNQAQLREEEEAVRDAGRILQVRGAKQPWWDRQGELSEPQGASGGQGKAGEWSREGSDTPSL